MKRITSEQQLNKQWNGHALLQPWRLGRRKWFNPDWTYKEDWNFSMIELSVYMSAAQRKIATNRKPRNGFIILQIHLAFSLSYTNLFAVWHFLFFLFPLSWNSDQRLYLYLSFLCTTLLFWTPHLISVSTGDSFALSHSSISGPAGSAQRPHQEDLIITVIVFIQSLQLWLPRTCPHLNHYLSPTYNKL